MNTDYNKKELEDRIRKKAYELWEKDGRKKGCELNYWLKAEKAIKGQIKR